MNKLFFLLLCCIVAQRPVNAMEQFPLHAAVRQGDIELVKALLLSNHGADINLRDNWGKTPLHRATCNGHEAIVKLLLDKGADINLQDDWLFWTPLHWAASKGHEAIIRLLLDKGTDINLKNNLGYTPLHWAASLGHEATVKLLLDRGADINLKNNIGWTPLQTATENGRHGVVQIIKERIKSQAFALAMGLHPRVEEDAPINILPGDGSVFNT